MFGIGFGELVIILLIALIVVGPERMPDLARRVGKTIYDLRRMYDNLRADLGPDFDEVERAIRTLRSLDPRRELDDAGRKLIMDLARDVGPEAETLMTSSPNEIKSSVAKSLLTGSTQTTNGTTPATDDATPAANTTTPAADTSASADTSTTPVAESNVAVTIPEPIVGDEYIAEPTRAVPSVIPVPDELIETAQSSPVATDTTSSSAPSSTLGSIQISAPAAPTVSRSRTYDIPQPVAPAPNTNGVARDMLADTTVIDTTHREESGTSTNNGHASS